MGDPKTPLETAMNAVFEKAEDILETLRILSETEEAIPSDEWIRLWDLYGKCLSSLFEWNPYIIYNLKERLENSLDIEDPRILSGRNI